jgi:pyridinium-3,5-bisthiocarboxylic acid mononucleotide nickel chelatase
MIGWIDARAGVSGDMLLGALVDCGIPLNELQTAVSQLGLGITLTSATCNRGGIGATKVDVHAEETQTTRHLSDIEKLLDRVEEPVRTTARAVFRRLAKAEARVHRIPMEHVHFHEVGALDTLADVVGVAAGFHRLGLDALQCSPISLGSGTTRGAHGPLPVPVPAVLELLVGIPVAAGPTPMECATPTGAALLATLVTDWNELPPITIDRIGCGAGQRDPRQVANVSRLVLGEPVKQVSGTVLLEANVDDLDPRLWPYAIERLMDSGADDAWLTPIVMKKGRPAHTLSVLCSAQRSGELRAVMFRETSTIGIRESAVAKKHALARSESTVYLFGQPVRIKTARLNGEVVNVNPEWRDVAAAAQELKMPAKEVLEQARQAASKV